MIMVVLNVVLARRLKKALNQDHDEYTYERLT